MSTNALFLMEQWNSKSKAVKNYLIQVKIPGTFLKQQFPLSGLELAFGFERRWVSGEDVVDVLAWWWGMGVSLTPVEQEIAGLFPNELWRLPELLEKCKKQDLEKDDQQIKYLWLYLILAWLYENRNEISDPLGEVEKLYADFDCPEEIQGLVRYMPPEDEPIGEEGIISLWGDYVRRTQLKFLSERGT